MVSLVTMWLFPWRWDHEIWLRSMESTKKVETLGTVPWELQLYKKLHWILKRGNDLSTCSNQHIFFFSEAGRLSVILVQPKKTCNINQYNNNASQPNSHSRNYSWSACQIGIGKQRPIRTSDQLVTSQNEQRSINLQNKRGKVSIPHWHI